MRGPLLAGRNKERLGQAYMGGAREAIGIPNYSLVLVVKCEVKKVLH